MLKTSKNSKILSLTLTAAGFLIFAGAVDTGAQTRDPFEKPTWAKPKNTSPAPSGSSASSTKSTGGEAVKPSGPSIVTAPPIQERINFYKRLREEAAANGETLPKVTSVLTLEEMSVTGIFRTPRGYAAMIEAKPINLSYTIYPGEKFFDGQLVAIEENRLVFRKVTKMTNGKFVSSVENKALRQYTMMETVQGTAPTDDAKRTEVAENAQPAPASQETKPASPAVIISPIDEMNKQTEPVKDAKQDSGKKTKKPVKVARNKK